MNQGVMEGAVSAEVKIGSGWEDVTGDRIMLMVAEMLENYVLDAEVGG